MKRYTSGDIRCILWGMNMKLVSSLMLCGWVAFLTGCVATADGHTKAGIPLAKDTITTRFDRAASQVQTASRKVLSDSGTLGLRLPQKNVTAHSYGSFDLAARSRIMISTMS